MSRMSGADVRTIRQALGLTASTFATVLGVHPTTVHRWEAAGKNLVIIEGIPWNVLLALRQRVISGRADRKVIKNGGQEVANALVVGGVLLALAALIALANGEN